MHNPFSIFDDTSWQLEMIVRFIIVLHDRVSTNEDIYEARRWIFYQKGQNIENIPPTRDTLYLHVMRAALRAAICAKSCISNS